MDLPEVGEEKRLSRNSKKGNASTLDGLAVLLSTTAWMCCLDPSAGSCLKWIDLPNVVEEEMLGTSSKTGKASTLDVLSVFCCHRQQPGCVARTLLQAAA